MLEPYNNVWKCTMCGKMSKRKSDLRKHTETHMVGMSHNCSTCGKTYRSKNSLQNHISVSHRLNK